jgi:dethiobiotin synthetase
MQKPGIIFVTGTDTGVGKTLFTGLLFLHLRSCGIRTLAMKPFSSGDRGDAKTLLGLQAGEVRLPEINPHHFRAPLAPLVAARKEKKSVRLAEAVADIRKLSRRCQVLLVEGAGGLMAPLGEGYTVADLIRRFDCEVVVVAGNRLGVINHTLLTVGALQDVGVKRIVVALMDRGGREASRRSNRQILAEMLGPVGVIGVRYLGKGALKMRALKKNAEKIKKTLARFVGRP